MANRHRKMQLFLTKDEDDLLTFAMRCTGLDRTTTMRLMMRRGAIEEVLRWKQTGVPKLNEPIMRLLEEAGIL